MADDNNEDDSWLYGSSNNENQPEDQQQIEDQNELKQNTDSREDFPINEQNNLETGEDNSDANKDAELDDTLENDTLNGSTDVNGENCNGDEDNEKNDDDDEDDSDDDDDVVVTIRDIQPASSFNVIKQRGLIATTTTTGEKPKANLGKFSIEEFESVGTISGQSAVEFNIEAIEDKPWRKPGADITDYFNYGFSEETWRAYCERQKRMRQHESGVGLASLGPNPPQGNSSQIGSNASRTLTSLTATENNKYSASNATNSHSAPNYANRSSFGAPQESPAKENVIQVMTAERREYSRAKGKFDVNMTMPPPPFMQNEPFYPEDNYSYGYEPTQEQQWTNDNNVGWVPSGIKELTPGPQMMSGPPPPHMNMNMPPPNAMMNVPPNMMNVPQMVPPPPHNMPLNMPTQMMPPPMNMGVPPGIPPGVPPNRNRNDDHRSNPNDYREHDDKRIPSVNQSSSSSSSSANWRSREKRDHRSRERDRDEDSPSDRDRRRDRGDRYRSSSRRERSRSRERSERRRRSKSRDKDRKSRDKKKSHKKDKDDSD